MKTNKYSSILKVLYYQKYLGLFLILLGIPMVMFAQEPDAEFPLMIGLFILYTSMEKVEDERSSGLKTSSLYFSFILGYTIKLVTSNFFAHDLISMQLVNINHFIILVFSIAVLIYYARLYVARS